MAGSRMAAVAAAWGAGLNWDTIKSGLARFVNDAHNAPGGVIAVTVEALSTITFVALLAEPVVLAFVGV